MMISAKRLALLIAVLGLMSAREARVEAGLVSYTETLTGSGSFGGTAYTNQLITISITADTSAITQPMTNIYYTASSLATITVDGLGSGTIMVNGFVNQSTSAFGFTTPLGGYNVDILDVSNVALSSYALGGPMDSVTGSAMINPNATFQTSAGGFNVKSFSGEVSFVASVPEPSSLALCGIAGLAALGYTRVRRKRKGNRSI